MISPFASLAEWLLDTLPPRVQGLAVFRPEEAAGTALPPQTALRLDLPPQALLVRPLALPSTKDQARRRAQIQAWLEENSPWVAGEYLWDALPALDDPGKVDVAMVPLAPIRETEKRLSAAGRRLAEVRGLSASGSVFRLRRDPLRLRRVRNGLLAIWLAMLTAALSVSAYMVWQARSSTAELARLEAAADRLARSAAEGLGSERAIRELAEAKSPASSVSYLLDHLAERLPPDAWLRSLTIEAGRFEMTGSTETPEAVIPSLQESPALAEVDFAGSSALDGDSGAYSFAVKGVSALPGGK